jgi:hypothetical protein
VTVSDQIECVIFILGNKDVLVASFLGGWFISRRRAGSIRGALKRRSHLLHPPWALTGGLQEAAPGPSAHEIKATSGRGTQVGGWWDHSVAKKKYRRPPAGTSRRHGIATIPLIGDGNVRRMTPRTSVSARASIRSMTDAPD